MQHSRPLTPPTTAHPDPLGCSLGFLGGSCPACSDVARNRSAAVIALAEASDVEVREAMHWLADEEPSHVLRALDAVRGTV